MGRGQGQAVLQPKRANSQENRFPFADRKTTSVKQLCDWPSINLDSQRQFYIDYDLLPEEMFKESNHQALQPDLWRKELDNFQAAGFRVEVPEKLIDYKTSLDNPRRDNQLAHLNITADIFEQESNLAIGEMTLLVNLGPDGQPELRIAGISLQRASVRHQQDQDDRNPDKYLGKGFAPKLISHLKEICRENKIPRISLHAIGLGAYAWTKYDFQLDPRIHYDKRIDTDYQSCVEEFNQSLEERLQRQIRFNYPQENQQQEINQLKSAKLKSLKDFSEYGKSKAKPGDAWLGKQAMIGACWHGILLVDF